MNADFSPDRSRETFSLTAGYLKKTRGSAVEARLPAAEEEIDGLRSSLCWHLTTPVPSG